MKIIKLEAENFMRLSAVTIEPNGAMVVIGGRNAQGKTSILRAIEAAIGGKGACPDVPVRHGEDEAHIVLETETLIVRRTFDADGGTRLEVRGTEGGVVASPQTLLNGLYGTLSFDPLAWVGKKEAEQAAELRRLAGLDFSGLDARESEYRADRTMVGREVKKLKGLAAGLSHHKDAPDDEVAIAELTASIEANRSVNRANHDKREDLSRMRADGDELLLDLEKAQQRVTAIKDEIEELTVRGRAAAAEVGGLKDEDVEGLVVQLAGAEDANRKVRENEAHAKAGEEYAAKQAAYDELTLKIDQAAETRAAAMSMASYPIDGLAITDAGVELNGLPLKQASAAEQLRCSVAIGLAANPELRVMLIRDGSLLDEDSLRMVAEMAAAADSQVWLERVGDGEEVTVVIEDGAVRVGDGDARA